MRADLPGRQLSSALAEWLQGPRSRALRRARIGFRRRVLELGCGHADVTPELARRAAGDVIALDIDPGAAAAASEHATAVCADARSLPFAAASFDLIFAQTTLMWIDPVEAAIEEAACALDTGGALVALEPDFGGMIEEPDLGLRVIWLDALERAGADPLAGRRLPGLAEAAGFDVWVELAHIPRQVEPAALDLLAELPLTALQGRRVEEAREIIARAGGSWQVLLHVPWVLLVATLS